MPENIHIHKILIIQALSEQDLKTGSKLEEDLDTFISAFNTKISVEIKNIYNKNDLYKLLDEVKNHIAIERKIPLIHIESHGSDDKKGLILPSGDFISWVDLKPIFTSINIKTRFNLFIVLAMCNGAYFLDTLNISDRSPCAGLLVPMQSVGQRPLLSAFIKFYERLFKTADIFESAIHINSTVEPHDAIYFFTSAHHHSEEIIKRLKENSMHQEEIRKDAKIIYRQLRKNKIHPLPSIGSITRMMKKKSPNLIKNIQDQYLMLDLFPENRKRLLHTSNML